MDTPTTQAPPVPSASIPLGTSTLGLPPVQSKMRTSVFIVLIVIMLLILIPVALTFAIAYNKLDINNPALQMEISQAVQNLPFTPKTSQYVILKAFEAHKKVSKHGLDLSVAVDSGAPLPAIGLSSFDGDLKGNVDYSDVKNPRFSLNGSLTKEFNFDARKNDKMVYLKINKAPWVYLLPFLGGSIDTKKVDQILADNWIGYDTTPLETDARATLNENPRNTSYTNEITQKALDVLTDKRIDAAIKMADDNLNGVSTHKITLALDSSLIDYIQSKWEDPSQKRLADYPSGYTRLKASDFYKNVAVSLWISKGDYFVRKATVSFTLSTPQNIPYTVVPSLPSDLKVALALNLNNFGQEVKVETPTKFLTPEDLTSMMYSSTSGIIDPKQLSLANNMKRRSDVNAILNAISQYSADNNDQYPPYFPTVKGRAVEVSNTGANLCYSLIPSYMASLPADPSVKPNSITNCSAAYHTGYFVINNGKNMTVTAPSAELNTEISVTR